MATPQVSSGYTPPIGGFWGNLPILSQINEFSDLVNNPDANVAHDVTGLVGGALPGPLGAGVSALSSALPGGWLDHVLGLGDFSSEITAPSAVGTGPMAGINYTPGLKGEVPGTGLWGAVQDFFNSIGSGITSGVGSVESALGMGGDQSSTDNTTNRSIGGKFGG